MGEKDDKPNKTAKPQPEEAKVEDPTMNANMPDPEEPEMMEQEMPKFRNQTMRRRKKKVQERGLNIDFL